MRKKLYDEDGFPVVQVGSGGPNLTVRNDDALRERIAALKEHYEAERRMPLSISDVVRAAVFKVYADVQGGAKQPPTPPPAAGHPFLFSECNQCEEVEDGQDYKCVKCGRDLKATQHSDLMCIQGQAKEIDPPKKPGKTPRKSKKAKE